MPRLLSSVVLLVLAAAWLPGCRPAATAVKPRAPQDAAADDKSTTQTTQGVTVEDDASKARLRFIGVKGKRGKGAGDPFLLRSWLVRSSRSVSHQLYVTDRYVAPAARGWSGAVGPNGEKLKVTKIETKTENCTPEGCPRTEAYGAAIDDAALRAARDHGYAVKFSADNGAKETITLSPEQIRAQLDAIDQKLASLPKPKPAAAKKHKAAATDEPVEVDPFKPSSPKKGGQPGNSGY